MLESRVRVETAGPQDKNKFGRRLSAQRAGWYILRCGAGLEFLAEKSLRDSGWEVFLPREPKWRPSIWRRRPQEAEQDYPRFPGYLLIATTPPRWPNWSVWPFAGWYRATLGMDGEPVPLAPGEIERLKAEDGRYVPRSTSVPVHKAFQPGDEARIKGGALRDRIVRIDVLDERGAHISVPLFGRHAKQVLPLTWLEAA